MSVCDLCGEKAGWFQNRHPSCEHRLEEAKKDAQALILEGAVSGEEYSKLEVDARRLSAERNVPFESLRESLLQGANDAASQIALNKPATDEDLNRVAGILQGFGIDAFSGQQVQRRWFGFASIGMSNTLWQVLNDVEPFYDGTGRMQFNLHAGEMPVFSVGSTTYAEERTVSDRGRAFSRVERTRRGGHVLPLGRVTTKPTTVVGTSSTRYRRNSHFQPGGVLRRPEEHVSDSARRCYSLSALH